MPNAIIAALVLGVTSL